MTHFVSAFLMAEYASLRAVTFRAFGWLGDKWNLVKRCAAANFSHTIQRYNVLLGKGTNMF